MCQIWTVSGKRERGQREGQQHGSGLGGDDDALRGCSGRPRCRPTGDSRKIGIWLAKPTAPSSTDEPGEAVDQPRLGNVLHPGADQGDELAAEEELKIAVSQRAQGGRKRHCAARPTRLPAAPCSRPW